MRTRRHHNNKGLRQIKSGNSTRKLRHIARMIGVPFDNRKKRLPKPTPEPSPEKASENE